MDTRAMQSHAHEYDEHHHHPHNVGSHQVGPGVEEHHDDHEKKSVLKKVKAKAKKIKNTITKHGHHDHEHGHEDEHQHIPDDHDLDEEDDEEEDMVEDPEVHGAPIYDSAAVRSATPGQLKTWEHGVHFGGTTIMGEEPHHEPRVVVASPTTEINQSRFTDRSRTFVGGEKTVQPKVNLERPMGLEADPHAPSSSPQAYAPANYQTKVTDPTGAGGAEIDTTPVEKSFARMTVHNEPKPNIEPKVLPTVAETHYPSTGSHNQFVPELSTATKTHYPYTESHDQNLLQPSGEIKNQYPKSHDQFMPDLSTSTKTQYPYPSTKSHDQNLSDLSSATKSQYPSAGSHDQFIPELSTEPKPQYPSAESHEQYLPQHSSATIAQYLSAGSHDQFTPEFSTQTKTAQSYDNFNNTVEDQPQPHNESMEKPSNQTSYTDKISLATSAIADKAITAKNAVASKLGYGEKGDDNRDENVTSGEKPTNQSSYTQKISSATSAIADKAASAKNTVASKLGFGEKDDREENVTTTHEENKSENASTTSGSATEYGKRIALSSTEKLEPVYGKVAGVGSAVKSKVPGTERGESVGMEQDKGVSVKDYLAEKFRPGEEDKALSEVISEKLYKKGEEPNYEEEREDRDVKKVVSDAVHKRGEEHDDRREERRPLGKVTESEEVKRRLGSGDEESYVNSPGKGVVDKLKGVVGSWFGKSEENQSLQGVEDLSRNSGAEVEQVNQAAGERRLQESSN